jgi:orotate phosphoribosyltransferase
MSCSGRPTRAFRWPPAPPWRLAGLGRNLPYAYNRKEAKDHGEGGSLVGAPLVGPRADHRRRDFGRHLGARIGGADPRRRRHAGRRVIALDRQERGQGELSAVQEVERDYGIPVISVASLTDLIDYLAGHPQLEGNLAAVRDYRARYGVD